MTIEWPCGHVDCGRDMRRYPHHHRCLDRVGPCSRDVFDSLSELGLTPEEQAVMDALVRAWAEFIALPAEHSSEVGDFAVAIHRLQDLLAVRVARRGFPGWRNTIGHGVHGPAEVVPCSGA